MTSCHFHIVLTVVVAVERWWCFWIWMHPTMIICAAVPLSDSKVCTGMFSSSSSAPTEFIFSLSYDASTWRSSICVARLVPCTDASGKLCVNYTACDTNLWFVETIRCWKVRAKEESKRRIFIGSTQQTTAKQKLSLSLQWERVVSVLALEISILFSSRQCFFGDERQLKYFRTYTQRNCEMECVSDYITKKCGCTRFSMPSNSNH